MVVRVLLISLTCCLFFVLLSCNTEPKSVEFYREHKLERADLIEKYRRNPNKYQDDPDIVNALMAEKIERFHSRSAFVGGVPYYQGIENRGRQAPTSKGSSSIYQQHAPFKDGR